MSMYRPGEHLQLFSLLIGDCFLIWFLLEKNHRVGFEKSLWPFIDAVIFRGQISLSAVDFTRYETGCSVKPIPKK